MREAFIKKRFNRSSVKLIEQANTIILEYQASGFSLTLRQLYYQFVQRGIIPNNIKSYKRLGSVINDARLAGQIDWTIIEDRTRNVRSVPTWATPSDILESVAAQYKEDLWARQPVHAEVWIEKDALIGVVEPTCRRWRAPFFACRGYTSQSEQYRAGKRFEEAQRDGKRPIVLHLGDHDPSGMDMTRDNAERLSMFARHGVEVRRLALNFDQVESYALPPNPAKEADSRAAGYIERFGMSSWELDALEPAVIAKLVDDEIASLVDPDLWSAGKADEAENQRVLQSASDHWPEVTTYLAEEFGE